jgi:two-component sensor histidine kinase/PAS domain-containing protein
MKATLNGVTESLKSMLNLSTDGFMIITKTYIIWCNDRALEMFSCEDEEAVRKDLIANDVINRLYTQKATSANTPIEINITGHGFFEFRIRQLLHGKDTWVLCIKDLNENKRLIRAAEKARLGFKNLLDNLNEGILLLNKGKIEFINTQGAEILKGTFDSCVGKAFTSFFQKTDQRKIVKRIQNTESGVLTAYEEMKTTHSGGEPNVGMSMILTIHDDKPMVQVTLTDLGPRNKLKQEQARVETLELANAALISEIEEHRKTKEKLLKQQSETKEQKKRLQAVYDSSGSALMCAIDSTGLVLVRNRTFLNWSVKHLGDPIQPGENLYKFLFEHRQREKYQNELQKLQENFTNGEIKNFEIALKNTFGVDIWLDVYLSMIHYNNGRKELAVMMFDNTEKRATEKRIRDSLLEKEVLLKEVHHRVKNNMQLISSMLNLQSSYSDNNELGEILRECQSRIQSMSFIHEMIYRNPNFNGIDAADYITRLCGQLIQGYSPSNTTLSMSQEIDNVFLSLDQAIPCGLIINELISNSLKHAFSGRKSGRLYILLTESGKEIKLTVGDDGIGLKEDFGESQTDSLGTQLVLALVQQLDGTLSTDRSSGTVINIVFPKK